MPSQEPDRSAEAVRRVLPELRKLDRYERRAAAQRERAVLDLCDRIKYKNNLQLYNWQNEPNFSQFIQRLDKSCLARTNHPT